MSMRLDIAEATGALSTWALRDILHRPAANFPGKLGLYVDPQLIADLKPRIHEGSIVIVGTNGKTTVTNLLADAFEAAGKSVICNRTGANLDSGVATALLQTDSADWGVFESDELWLSKVAPQLQPDFVVLLNLFRDQLDRMGEIDHIEAAIAEALSSSPDTTFIYNADDPFSQSIAEQVDNDCIAFGFDEDLNLAQNTVADASICQRCESSLLAYEWRQYGQLGAFQCPHCGFTRIQPAYSAANARMSAEGSTFDVRYGGRDEAGNPTGPDDGSPSAAASLQASDTSACHTANVPFSGTYMLYNALAVYAAADCCGLSLECVDKAIEAFMPENGRLQRYEIDGRNVLLNLAKNPTGFNQNLRIVMGEEGPKAVAFYINDKEADGHDVSWLWDVDFQELADSDDLLVFAGGIRRNDMQVRLKYAGIDAQLVDGATDFLAKADAASPGASMFLIANYTALPDVKAELDELQHLPGKFGKVKKNGREYIQIDSVEGDWQDSDEIASAEKREHAREDELSDSRGNEQGEERGTPHDTALIAPSTGEKLTIVHMYPELLNLYGDGGNVTILAHRARQRGLDVDVVRVTHGQKADLDNADIVFLGGGPDREQHLASHDLVEQTEDLRAYVEDDGVLLAICGGYQILGREWLLGDESVPGLAILDMTTKRAEGGSHNRLVGNIALESPLATMPVIGYENHAGRTFLGAGCEPFGRVVGKHGKGNNDEDGADGARYRNVVATYLHGPLLSKNPEVADWLIERALDRRAAKEMAAEKREPWSLTPGETCSCESTVAHSLDAALTVSIHTELTSLDDSAERAANDFMCKKLNVHGMP